MSPASRCQGYYDEDTPRPCRQRSPLTVSKVHFVPVQLHAAQPRDDSHDEAQHLCRSMRTATDRSIVVDWLMELKVKLGIRRETLFLAVNILDRALERPSRREIRVTQPAVKRGPHTSTANIEAQIQLVCDAAAALSIACKYEEGAVGLGSRFMADHAYSIFLDLVRAALIENVDPSDIDTEWLTQSELDVLNRVDWACSAATVDSHVMKYLDLLCNDSESESEAEDGYDCSYGIATCTTLVCYLSELALLDYNMLKYEPAVVAAAAVSLSREKLGERAAPWPERLELLTGIARTDIVACVDELHALHLLYGTGLNNVCLTVDGKRVEKTVWCGFQQGAATVCKIYRQEIAIMQMQPLSS
eukprot:g1913.t1